MTISTTILTTAIRSKFNIALYERIGLKQLGNNKNVKTI